MAGIVRVALLCSAILGAQTARPPRFEDYPVTEVWQGVAAPLKLTTRSERMFRTQLTEAAKQAPDFAGHYKFAGWGCGSACAAGAIIDLQTGDVLPPPRGSHGNGWDRWIFCGGVFDRPYVECRRDSRLLILRCSAGSDWGPDVFYFVLDGSQFRQLLRIRARIPK